MVEVGSRTPLVFDIIRDATSAQQRIPLRQINSDAPHKWQCEHEGTSPP